MKNVTYPVTGFISGYLVAVIAPGYGASILVHMWINAAHFT